MGRAEQGRRCGKVGGQQQLKLLTPDYLVRGPSRPTATEVVLRPASRKVSSGPKKRSLIKASSFGGTGKFSYRPTVTYPRSGSNFPLSTKRSEHSCAHAAG
jgi:hypothetical protein